jgi:hypothetical protein
MQLTFLGKSTQGGGSPTLFATDRQTYVVQGWKVPNQDTSVEIPKHLLTYVEARTSLGAALEDTGRDSYVLSGEPVTDREALSQMDIPSHETCVEVGRVREGDDVGSATG